MRFLPLIDHRFHMLRMKCVVFRSLDGKLVICAGARYHAVMKSYPVVVLGSYTVGSMFVRMTLFYMCLRAHIVENDEIVPVAIL